MLEIGISIGIIIGIIVGASALFQGHHLWRKKVIWQSLDKPVSGKKLKRAKLDYYLNYVGQSTPVLIYEDRADTWILYTE